MGKSFSDLFFRLGVALFLSLISLQGIDSSRPIDPTNNEKCTNATLIQGSSPFMDSGSTAQASPVGADSPAMTCSVVEGNTTRGVWYLLQGDGRCYATSTEGSTFDTVLAVYNTTNGCEMLSCLKENDNFNDLTSQVNWNTATGTDYYILVAGVSDDTGSYNLTVQVRQARVFGPSSSISHFLTFLVFCLPME